MSEPLEPGYGGAGQVLTQGPPPGAGALRKVRRARLIDLGVVGRDERGPQHGGLAHRTVGS